MIGAGIFYLLCMLAQTWGFGTGKAGVAAFGSSARRSATWASPTSARGWATRSTSVPPVSGFASALATATGASRILFAMGRDGFVTPRLGSSSERTGAPAVALACVMAIACAGLAGMRAYGISDAVSAFFYPGTLGVLSLIVAYAVTNVGAAKLFLTDSAERAWELVFPVVAIIVLAYVFDRNAVGQVYPFNWFPWVVMAWLAVGLAIIMAIPGLARRIGANLTAAEGMGGLTVSRRRGAGIRGCRSPRRHQREQQSADADRRPDVGDAGDQRPAHPLADVGQRVERRHDLEPAQARSDGHGYWLLPVKSSGVSTSVNMTLIGSAARACPGSGPSRRRPASPARGRRRTAPRRPPATARSRG